MTSIVTARPARAAHAQIVRAVINDAGDWEMSLPTLKKDQQKKNDIPAGELKGYIRDHHGVIDDFAGENINRRHIAYHRTTDALHRNTCMSPARSVFMRA